MCYALRCKNVLTRLSFINVNLECILKNVLNFLEKRDTAQMTSETATPFLGKQFFKYCSNIFFFIVKGINWFYDFKIDY